MHEEYVEIIFTLSIFKYIHKILRKIKCKAKLNDAMDPKQTAILHHQHKILKIKNILPNVVRFWMDIRHTKVITSFYIPARCN